MSTAAPFETTPLAFKEKPAAEMQMCANDFYREMNRRRTVRDFSSRPVSRCVIEACLLTAGTSPSGAN